MKRLLLPLIWLWRLPRFLRMGVRHGRRALFKAVGRLLKALFTTLDQLFERHRHGSLKILFVVLVAFFLFAEKIVIVIPSGHAGVIWKRFGGGTVEQPAIGEGTVLIWPWDRLVQYEMRSQIDNRTYRVVTEDGLTVDIGVSYRYIPNPAVLGSLHKLVGPDFARVLLEPEVSAATHQVIANFRSDKLYSAERAELRELILARILKSMEVEIHGQIETLVTFQEFLLNRLVLPPRVSDAIEEKEKQHQKVQEYTYRIESQEKESERQLKEARGIREFMDAVSPGITPEYLRLQGVNVTRELVKSPNSKIIMIGGGQKRTPIIVDTSTSQPMLAAKPAPAMASDDEGGQGEAMTSKSSSSTATPSHH